MRPFLPGATDHHLLKALRFCPTMSSTSGMSASRQGPVAPSGPDAIVTLCMTSANTRTSDAGMVAAFGPVSSRDHEYDQRLSAAVAPGETRTTARKGSDIVPAAGTVAAGA